MSIEKGLQKIGQVYIYLWIFGALLTFIGCLVGIILLWTISNPPSANIPAEDNPDSKTIKIVWTGILAFFMLLVPFVIYILYSNRKNKNFDEFAGVAGLFNTIKN